MHVLLNDHQTVTFKLNMWNFEMYNIWVTVYGTCSTDDMHIVKYYSMQRMYMTIYSINLPSTKVSLQQ